MDAGQNRGFVLHVLSVAVGAAIAAPATAIDFEVGDGWKGSWTSSFSVGSSFRARDRDPRLYGKADGALVGLTNGSGNNTIDEGELNYGKGDAFSTPIKLISEVEVKKNELGFLLRGKAWDDYTLTHGDATFGNQNNGYNGYNFATNRLGSPRPLSDNGFEPLNRYKGVYLLDAYAYDTFDIHNQPLQVRVGNQVVNWGESLFIQGINQINPIDVPSFHKPGAQLKEVFLPVPIVFANQSLGEYGGFDLFYQVKWADTPVDMGCGNYWAVAAGNIGYSPGPCNNAVTLVGSNPFGVDANAYVKTIDGRKPKSAGELGAAYRFTSQALDTEFGLYGMQIHSRTPVVSVQFGQGGTASPFAAEWDYPEDIRVFGISASTNILGWSVGSELSRRNNVPAQIDGNDLLLAGLGAGGALPFAAGLSIPFGPVGPLAVAAHRGPTGYLPGYTRTHVTQFQLNTVKAGNRILGADQYILVAEAGFQWNGLPNYKTDPNALRYNRPFIFGPGPSPLFGGAPCMALNISAEGCQNDGYATPFAWGYRLKLDLTYNDVFRGVSLTPNIFWSQDVSGWSVDNQFAQARYALGLGLKFTYARNYTLDLNYTTYNHNANYDPLRDRDFISFNLAVGF